MEISRPMTQTTHKNHLTTSRPLINPRTVSAAQNVKNLMCCPGLHVDLLNLSQLSRYSWRLNGVIQENETKDVLEVRATASNAGFYECLASNEWGTAISQSVSMTVAYIDEFMDRTTKALTTAPNGAAEFECRGKPDSKPPASYSWRRFTSASADPVSDVLTSSRVQIDQSTGKSQATKGL